MKEVDWSKAPEDATHYLPTDVNRCWSACWYKQNSFGRWLGKNASSYDNGWDDGWAIDDDQVEAFVPTLIARPSSNWSGQGNPQVGTVCELRTKTGGWGVAEIKYISSTICVWLWIRYDGGVQSLEFAEVPWKLEFRPIKTQEQIATEEREKAIEEMRVIVGSHNSFPFTELYDAGYRLTKTEGQ